MGLFDRLNSDGEGEKATETIKREEEISLPCTYIEALGQVEAEIHDRYDVKHIDSAKASRYNRHMRVIIRAVVWESGDD